MSKSRFLRAAAFALALGCAAGMALAAPKVETPEAAQRPEIEVTPFSGPAFHLSAQRGKWVLVYYWASWCPPCTKALPVVSRFVAAHRDVAAIGLAVMQPKAQDAERFASEHDPGFPLAWLDADATQRLTRITGKLVGIPFTWLIAPDGTTKRKYTGPVTARMLEDDIAAFGGPKPDAATPAG